MSTLYMNYLASAACTLYKYFILAFFAGSRRTGSEYGTVVGLKL